MRRVDPELEDLREPAVGRKHGHIDLAEHAPRLDRREVSDPPQDRADRGATVDGKLRTAADHERLELAARRLDVILARTSVAGRDPFVLELDAYEHLEVGWTSQPAHAPTSRYRRASSHVAGSRSSAARNKPSSL